jgi:hypothetical protein
MPIACQLKPRCLQSQRWRSNVICACVGPKFIANAKEIMMKRSSHFTRLTLSTVAVLTLTTATQGVAQSGAISLPPDDPIALTQFLEDIGASERIDMAGKLRMLSQRMPAAACTEHAGIAVEQSKAVLHAAKEEFDTILAALEFGDAELGIVGEEDRRKTLAAIAAVHAEYDPLHALFDDIEETGGTDEEVAEIANHDLLILEAAKVLVSEVSGQYADPTALLQSDALTLDIAGRQRMLSQKISKEVCYITSDIHGDEALLTLGGTINMFETSLNALMFGMEGTGITAAPTDEILAGLERVKANWDEVSGSIASIADGGTVDDDTRALIFTDLNKVMANMNAVVGLYSDNSKLGL